MKVEDVPDEWRQVARMAFTKAFASTAGTCALDAALAAVIPAIQAEALERAAVVVETSLYIMSGSQPSHLQHDPKRAKNDNHHATIAAAIRALKEGT